MILYHIKVSHISSQYSPPGSRLLAPSLSSLLVQAQGSISPFGIKILRVVLIE